MNKPIRPSSANENSFTTLANVTEKLSQGRSDGVAMTAIFSLTVCFMTVIIVGGFVYAASQNPKADINAKPIQSDKLSNQ